MEILKFSVLFFVFSSSCCFSSVSSQQQPIAPLGNQQNVHPVHQSSNLGNNPAIADQAVLGSPLDNGEPQTVTNHYPYQSTGLAPTNYHPSYTGPSYGRDVYNSNREGWGSGSGWYPYFGINAGTAWELSAYFGQVFWAVVAVLVAFVACLGVTRLFVGGDVLGGLFQRIKENAPSGRSLDLDNLTNIVYQALETYGKFAAKDVRQGVTQNMKG
ncbi:unnamed protein product [Orchesella dallaii]|uniref:Uncharacterized protein n=1 Tax=Orchesella dallaii TaxID=48710 RepID=A0ABP1PY40_9HEXA